MITIAQPTGTAPATWKSPIPFRPATCENRTSFRSERAIASAARMNIATWTAGAAETADCEPAHPRTSPPLSRGGRRLSWWPREEREATTAATGSFRVEALRWTSC
eukprot:7382971-Prymnesium_polylepis.1